MAKFTLDQITEALESVVAERGEDYKFLDHFYGCQYIAVPKDGTLKEVPACIVGATFAKLGVTNKTLKRWNDGTDGDSQVPNLKTSLIPKNAIHPLTEAQIAQDSSHTWGEALAAYKAALSDV